MSKKTIDAAAIATSLTPKGREFMRAVGAGEFSFFDGGIKEQEGCWGSVLSGEHFTSVRSASGVMGATAKAGLWQVTTEQDPNSPDAGAWWSLTAEGAAVALHLAEQPSKAPSTADEAAAAEFTAKPAEQPEFAAVATKDWRGNYNTVFAPAAELLAASADVEVRTVVASTMLRQTDVAGPEAKAFFDSLVTLEQDALAALKTWQKTLKRADASDMEKYNQNRSFLAGYLAAAAQRASGSKKMPVIGFAKDMERALRADALKAGAAAAKATD